MTFISGAGSFALLALGMLLMRPASLMQSALPDLERPAMSRAIAAGDMAALARIQRAFHLGADRRPGWSMCCSAPRVLAFFPHLVLKKGYGLHDVILVAILSSIIMAVRAWRTPLAVLLQAAGQFKELASIGTVSGALSVLATLALLLTFGPDRLAGRHSAGRAGDPGPRDPDGARLEARPWLIASSICIPTFRRPRMLKRLLDAIAALKTSAGSRVLVADNDAESHAGFDLCRALTDYPWPLTAVIAEKRGIAQVRNTLIEKALEDRRPVHRHDRR